jgi:hypothetical protein
VQKSLFFLENVSGRVLICVVINKKHTYCINSSVHHTMFKPNFSCCSGDADLPNNIYKEIYVLAFKKSFLKDLTFTSCITEKIIT